MDLRRYSLLTEDLFRSLIEFDIQEKFEYIKGDDYDYAAREKIFNDEYLRNKKQ